MSRQDELESSLMGLEGNVETALREMKAVTDELGMDFAARVKDVVDRAENE